MQVSSFVRQFMTYFLYIKFDFILVDEKCCLFTKISKRDGSLVFCPQSFVRPARSRSEQEKC
jgi:hypothetical protein